MKTLFIPAFISIFYHVAAPSPKIPEWSMLEYKKQHLDLQYDLNTALKPIFLQADFNGDGFNDIAILVTGKKTHKKGILLLLGNTSKYVVFGAGNKVGKTGFDATDDLKWVEGWKVYKQHVAYETKFNNGDMVGSIKRRLPHAGISIWSLEDGEPIAGGIIYWNGNKWAWLHQGE